ncbi:hypothetical protein GCM10017673_36510 [Streptosporangium violaceochromogenes]|nr:hypothetical protein GCM10017673_36510 [Streptosporangium violaceochromogenes]
MAVRIQVTGVLVVAPEDSERLSDCLAVRIRHGKWRGLVDGVVRKAVVIAGNPVSAWCGMVRREPGRAL